MSVQPVSHGKPAPQAEKTVPAPVAAPKPANQNNAIPKDSVTISSAAQAKQTAKASTPESK
jgi:hypothetical protein